ncbi:hypothetical protein Leryth_008602 [Lithospermum erythrorhizon]|nr:hypothetical protein Leryth_008602 [Lithospermum erythrorhizon]
MVDVHRKTNMKISSEIPIKSPRLSTKQEISIPPPSTFRAAELLPASDAACSAYEHYIKLDELKKLWETNEFPGWTWEKLLKPALQGLELTFRFVSSALFDTRPYSNKREWKKRLEKLATTQVEIIAELFEEDEEENHQTWHKKIPESQISEESLLPRLATWKKTEDFAKKVYSSIELEMMKIPYNLGLGEPNVSHKPSLDYDLICKPLKLHGMKQSTVISQNFEDHTLFTIHQLLETWIHVSKMVLENVASMITSKDFQKASSSCWLLEKIWKLLGDIEETHLLMDPDDFLRLKNQLSIKARAETELFCFHSRALIDITKLSKDLRHKVPEILEAVVDPMGGPRIQEAAMSLYRRKDEFERIHLLQALQAVEMAVKKFYYSYKQLLVIVMGSLEATANKGVGNIDSGGDLLDQIILEPTYYPSLDAAKTFLGYYWSHEREVWSRGGSHSDLS